MNKKFLFIGLAAILLNSCSEFYGYQPPAPIYGEGEVTNPYFRVIPSKPIGSVKEDEAEPKDIKAPIAIENSIVPQKNVPTKRVAPPAILALVTEADRSSQSGDFDSAVVTIERALRIDSRNPELTYKLASLRLKQSKPRLAEDLAKKAALLAVNDRELKKRSWLLISEARRQQKKYDGAKKAKLKAENL